MDRDQRQDRGAVSERLSQVGWGHHIKHYIYTYIDSMGIAFFLNPLFVIDMLLYTLYTLDNIIVLYCHS